MAYVNEQRRQAETKKLVKENEIRIARMDAVAKEELELAVSVVRQEALKAEEVLSRDLIWHSQLQGRLLWS